MAERPNKLYAESIEDFFEAYEKGIKEAQRKQRFVASGKSARDIRVSKGQLLLPIQYATMEFGIAPGRFKPPQAIEEWMKSKGIEGSAYAINKALAERGDQVFRNQREGLKTEEVMDKSADELASDIADDSVEIVVESIERQGAR